MITLMHSLSFLAFPSFPQGKVIQLSFQLIARINFRPFCVEEETHLLFSPSTWGVRVHHSLSLFN